MKIDSILLLLICSIGIIKSETPSESNSTLSSKNSVYFDAMLSRGALFGLHYERVLTRVTSVEIGLSPILINNYRGMVIPVGVNILLPLGDKHKAGIMLKNLFFSGSDPDIHEREGHLFTAELNNRQNSLPLYGVFYQYNSDYLITYRFGIGGIITEPILALSIGYNF